MDQLFAGALNGGIQPTVMDTIMSETPTAILVHLQYGSHREKLILERSERPEISFQVPETLSPFRFRRSLISSERLNNWWKELWTKV